MSKGIIDGSIQIENPKMSNSFKCPRSKFKLQMFQASIHTKKTKMKNCLKGPRGSQKL
jgi:hypothetical protein